MRLDLFPLNTVLFPRMHLPLHIFEPRYRVMIHDCIENERPFGVALIQSGNEVGPPADPFDIGTTAHILRHETIGDGRMNIETLGRDRFHINTIEQTKPHLIADVTIQPMPTADLSTVTALAGTVARDYHEVLGMMLELQTAFAPNPSMPKDPEHFAYFIASALPTDAVTQQLLLESANVDALLAAEAELVIRLVRKLKNRLEDQHATRLN